MDNNRGQGEQPDDPNEFPAVPVPWSLVTGQYYASVTTGTNELIAHLNDRYAGDGPTGGGSCSNETLVMGGYSQGAHAIGDALERTGYGSLSQAARDHIGYVALYGDPTSNRLSSPCPLSMRANAPCGQGNNAGALYGRGVVFPVAWAGSWCDQFDGVCNRASQFGYNGTLEGNHTSAYRDWWIWQSAAEIAHAARIKRCSFNPCTSNQVYITSTAAINGKTTIGFGNWTEQVGPGNANKIAAGGSNQLFIRGDAAVFGRSGIGTTWIQQVGPGNANAIAVSSTGVVMFIRGDAAIFAKQGVGSTVWTEEVGPGNAAAIAVGGNTQMFIRGDGAIFAKDTIGANGWTQEVGPGNATKIAVSSTGVQMFIRGDGAVFAKRGIGNGGWVQEVGPGNATAIAVGGETQMFIRGDGAVFAKNWIGDGGWVQQTSPGNAQAIAVCDDGTQMFLRGDGMVFAKRGIAANWTEETSAGSANAIACG
nr:cutinase family protein [Micromonospora tarapacensis]